MEELAGQEMCTLVLRCAYDGAGFCGFAKQTDPPVRTVQGCIEQALATVFRMPVPTVCAGRTDTGVHALDQHLSCSVPRALLEKSSSYTLVKSLNALTDDDIAVFEAGIAADPGFSARFSVEQREYRYRIVFGSVPPLFLRRYVWWVRTPLDVQAMSEAAAYLVGEHDFKSFCKAESSVDKNTVRTLHSVELEWEEQLGERCLVVRVVGNAFLHSQIRTIVGSLVDVGAGRRAPAWMGEVLAARDRTAAGPNAPACGLVFHKVSYPAGSWQVF